MSHERFMDRYIDRLFIPYLKGLISSYLIWRGWTTHSVTVLEDFSRLKASWYLRLSTSFFIWGTSHSSMVQLDVGLFYLCAEKTPRLQYINVPQSSTKQVVATAATKEGSAAEHTWFASAPQSFTSPYGNVCSIQRTNKCCQNWQIHFHTSDCICLATTESLEQRASSLRGGLWWIAQIWLGYNCISNNTIQQLTHWCNIPVIDLCFLKVIFVDLV